MRCTRCDRPAVPQATGVTPAGVFVFGWCVACLEATECHRIVVAPRLRHPTTLLRLETTVPRSSPPERPRGPLDDRRRLAGAVALVLSLWGIVLMSGGLILWAVGPVRPLPSPETGASVMRVGGPSLLIGGGGTTAVVGFLLWSLNAGPAPLRSTRALRVVQGLAFASAFGTVLAGIVFHSPRRDPLVVGIASAALVVSAAARWIEVRKTRGVAAWGPDLP